MHKLALSFAKAKIFMNKIVMFYTVFLEICRSTNLRLEKIIVSCSYPTGPIFGADLKISKVRKYWGTNPTSKVEKNINFFCDLPLFVFVIK